MAIFSNPMNLRLPRPEEALFLVDPLGNLILRYPADPDIQRLNKDLTRQRYAGRIGCCSPGRLALG